ncbi:type IV secretory system conjugative DNA transfer family protein [Coprococcus comes]|nr:type IV secretory system conjugative DNA transfer family protein [Coprococcus comes]
MVNRMIESVKMAQENVGLLKYPALIVGSTIIANKLFKWNKERKCVLKTDLPKKAQGVLFGKKRGKIVYSPTDQEGHIAVFGGSGSGKTSAILVPTLRTWGGTSFVIDISGDICKNVDDVNKLVYEPANAHSTPYNIFGAIDDLKTETERMQALEQLAFLLMPESQNMNDVSLFYLTEGRKILTAALIAFYSQGMDFIPICEKIVSSNWKDLFNAIDATNNAKASAYITSFVGNSETTNAGCKQSADSALKLFALNDIVKQTIRRPTKGEISITPQMLEKHSIYVVLEDSKLKLYAPLLHIITSQILEFFSDRPLGADNTILLALDEFASLGKLDITDGLRKLRKKHVRIMMITQSMADIDLIYGKPEREAMMNNFAYKVVLGASDTETQEYFAKLIGYTSVPRKSVSRNGKSVTTTESDTKDFAVEPASLAHLQDKLLVLNPDGFIKLRKNYFYKS